MCSRRKLKLWSRVIFSPKVHAVNKFTDKSFCTIWYSFSEYDGIMRTIRELTQKETVKTVTVFLTCFDSTTFLQNLLLKWRRYQVFPAKMTLVCAFTVALRENLVLAVVLVLESKALFYRVSLAAKFNFKELISVIVSDFFLVPISWFSSRIKLYVHV